MDMAAQYITDDFVFEGWTTQRLDRGEFLALQSELHAAMPDYAFNLSNVRQQNAVVSALMQITGTQTHPLSLPMFGIPLVPYTGTLVILPQEHVQFVIADGKVSQMRVETVPGGGLAGLLQQLDTDLPLSPRVGSIYELASDERDQEIEAHGEASQLSREDTMADEDAG
jgi:hypothetical protein